MEQRVVESFGLEERKLNERMKQIEEWTGMKVGNVIFDSDVDDWGHQTSIFDQKIIKKSNIIILIEDSDGDLFGGFFAVNVVSLWASTNDEKSFVFSFKPNEMVKFDIIKPKDALIVYSKDSSWLFSIGNGGYGNQDDISVMKLFCEGRGQFSGCNQSTFYYNGIENAICGKSDFVPIRVTVIQLI